MTHRFPIKEIALQAGLGTATVDRVLNNRASVSPQTRARVMAALAELEAQEKQLSARGRRMFIDVVMEAPRRFCNQVQAACESVLPEAGEAVFRPRFLFQEIMTETDIVAILRRIKKRGSHGVILKARDLPTVLSMVNEVEAANIPVVTLVSDLPGSERSGYVGVDNGEAGRTAAYLLANLLRPLPSTILASRSQDSFQGESERYLAFRHQFLTLRPECKIVEITGGAGRSGDTGRRLEVELSRLSTIDAVYSMGGGNRAILDVMEQERNLLQHFVAHDLDRDNIKLLQQGRIGFVLHHDLRIDLRSAFRILSAQHGLAPPTEKILLSDVQIVTPHNIPNEYLG